MDRCEVRWIIKIRRVSRSPRRSCLIGKEVLLSWAWVCQHALLLDALALRTIEHAGIGARVLGQIVAAGRVELVDRLVVSWAHRLLLACDGLQSRHLRNLHVCRVLVPRTQVVVVLAELFVVVSARSRVLSYLSSTFTNFSKEWSGRRERREGALRSLVSLAS